MPKRESRGLGVLVREAREKMGWTQEQLARRLAVDKGYISAIEIGTRRWPLQHTEALAETLGLDLVEMAVAAEMLPPKVLERRTVADDFAPDDPARELLAIMRKANYSDRKELLDYAKFKGMAQVISEA